ncbi:MAG: rRNA maturation RNase YbeY [Acidobacteriaceae bacterium]|jgi:probable rRNA maturation factor|nr:rRNA maturation RNase YbeY [Acidobacteriaceae bacterium]
MIVVATPSRRVSRPVLERFLAQARRAVGLRGVVDVLLADDAELKRLNTVFRGKKKPTDVLSFPADDPGGKLAGDIAISLETAARQAAEFGHTLQSEVKILLLHGLLHLNGMDHETDEGEMAAQEMALRTRLKLSAGLIARAAKQAAGPPRKAMRLPKKAKP